MTETRYVHLALLYLMGFVALPVLAETQTDDTLDIETIKKNWKCKYCADLTEKQWEGYFSLGLGYVSNNSYKFGEYNGLNERGFNLDGNLNARYRDNQRNYWDIRGQNVGLESPSFGVEGGRQGQYKLNLEMDQITRYNLDTGRTPYSGDSIQTLPAGWVHAANTAGFTTLATGLHEVNFSTQRRHFTLGGEYISSTKWSYEVWFKRQTKQGNQPTAYSFGFDRAAMLSKPIDYSTDDIELKVNYHYADFSGQVALINSNFKNTNTFLRWENAYDTPTGAPQGQAGTEPDNSKQQILLTGNYFGIKNVQFTGLFSYALLKQDEAFLPYSVNSDLTPPALPQHSLKGKVAVFNTNLAAHWQYSSAQDWHLIYEHHEQDNSTARNTYTYVTADNAVTSTPRANFPYGFRQQKLKLNTDYKFDNQVKLSGGGQLSTIDRDYQSVESTAEANLWAKLKHRIDNKLHYSLKAEFSDRTIDNYNVASEVTPADNPLMRKYNITDRQGHKIDVNLTYTATDAVILNFSSDIAQYNYDATTIGLTQSDELSAGLDIQYMVNKNVSFTGFIHNTQIKSQQVGSQAFSTPDWTANNKDKILTVGLGSDYLIIKNKLKLGLDYVHAESNAAIDISLGSPFPDLTTKRDTIMVRADYTIDEKFTLKASYQYEKYMEDNWYINNVAPATLSNVLTFGNTPPTYKIGVFWLTLRYNF
ncbi:MAG: MtrB/PioB family decaheme-associated outer membrane protein [Gammaproteobacteria bacterium]|nr:MtrB/PioB family decaheme-associated outer membrane protein [Gammaproteobacteria bacterium]